MAVGSSKKKKLKPNRPSSSSSNLSSPMASTSSLIHPKSIRSRKISPIPLLVVAALAASFLLVYVFSQGESPPPPPPPPPLIEGSDAKLYGIDVVNEYPHDPNAFTQGLIYGGNDTLFESTGLYGRSSVRQVHLQTGKVLVNHQMGISYFGEGLTLLGERLFQVTWLKNTGFIYDRYDFSKPKIFTHPMQDGWGLAADGKVIFGSDGSSTLYQLDPLIWQALRKVTVRYNDHEVLYLNELEYINGEVWANVWQSDCIARISHDDGVVRSWILLHELREGLLRLGHRGIDVLNGIAWDEEKKRLFVTGKLWPKLYEIKLRPVTTPLNRKIEDLCSLRT